MKTILTSILMAFLLMAAFAVPLALAEDNESDTNDDSSDAIALYDDTSDLPEGMVISPGPMNAESEDNETVSSWQIFNAQTRIWFTFNQEKKAERELQLANMRLIQARIAAKNNNSQAMENALEAHERIMNRVQIRYEKLANASENMAPLDNAIAVHQAKVAAMQGILENVNLTGTQRTRIEARLTQMNEVTGNLMQIQERARERLTERLANNTENTEENQEQNEGQGSGNADEALDNGSNEDSGNKQAGKA